MKKILIAFVFMFLGYQSQSQVLMTVLFGEKLNSDGIEFGLVGGVNWAQISHMDAQNYALKWNLGYYFDIRLKNSLSLYTGLLVKSNFGTDELSDEDLNFLKATIYYNSSEESEKLKGDYSQKMNVFMLPILAKFKFKNHFHISLGPQFSLMYKSWIEFNSDIEGREMIMKEFNTDQLNRIDAGIVGGLGYRFMKGTGWTLEGRYYQGFANVYKNRKGTHNTSFFLELNIPIGAAKN